MTRAYPWRNLIIIYGAMLLALGAGLAANAHRTLPQPPKPVPANLGWGHCTPRNAPSCDEGTTCPDGSCASCYTFDGIHWQCCCPFGPNKPRKH